MTARPLLILGAWIGGLLCAILLASFWLRGNVSADLSQFLPQKGSADNQLLLETIRSNPSTNILMVSLRGSDTQDLAVSNKKLAQQIKQLPGVVQVVNGRVRLTREDRKLLLRYHYLLNPELTADYFSAATIDARLTKLVNEMASPAPLIDKSLLRHDPLLSIPAVLSSWQQKSAASKKFGVWFNSAGTETLIFVRTQAGGFDINKQQKIVRGIKAEFEKLSLKDTELTMSGPGYYAVVYRELIKQDIVRLSVMAGILVCLLLLFMYRSLRMLLFAVLPLATAIVAGVLSVLAVFGGIHGITLAFGITLIGMTIDYPIHLFTHVRKGNNSTQAIASVWPTLRLGIMTTMLGFVAMLLAGFEGLRQLAVFAVSGLLFAGLFTRWVLPYAVPEDFSVKTPGFLLKVSSTLVNWSGKLFPLFLLVVLIALVSAFMQDGIIDHDLKKLSPLSEKHRSIDRRLRKLIGTEDSRFVVTVSAKSLQSGLQTLELLQPKLDHLVKQKVVAGHDSVSKYLPSDKLQEQRLSYIPDVTSVQARFESAAQKHGIKTAYFRPFYKNIQTIKSGGILTYQQALKTPVGIKLQTLVIPHNNRWLILVPLKKVKDRPAIKRWAEQIQIPGVKLLDLREEANSAVTAYIDSALWVSLFGSGIIILILWVGLRSFTEVIRVTAPIVSAILITIMVWSLLGVKLNIFHMVSLLLVVGIGIDYALFFNRTTSKHDHALDCLAIWICNLTTVIVFGLLFFSFQPVLIAIGGTVAVGALAANLIAASVARISGKIG